MLDIYGIALAMVIANFVYFIIMMVKIVSKLDLDVYSIFTKFIKNLSIAILSGIIGLLVYMKLSSYSYSLINYGIFNILIPSLVILGVYILLAKGLKFEEVNDF